MILGKASLNSESREGFGAGVVPKSNSAERIGGLSLGAIVDGSLARDALGSDFNGIEDCACEGPGNNFCAPKC